MIISVSLAITFLATSVFLAVVSSKWKTIAERVPELETELCFLSMHYAERQTELEKVSKEYGHLASLFDENLSDIEKMLEQFEVFNLQIKLLQEQLNEKEEVIEQQKETIEKLDEIFRSHTDSNSDNSLSPRGSCAPSSYS